MLSDQCRYGQTHPVDRVLERLRQHGNKVEQHSGYWTAHCPAHDDQRSSLSIGEGGDGRALLKCHAGCHWRDVARALALEPADLFPGDQVPRAVGPSPSPPGRRNSEYSYRDEAGELLYQVVRTPDKQFWVRRPAAGGGWEFGLGPAPRLLYRLPELIAAAEGSLVFVVEGEKDVETLRACGLTGTTNLGGAGKWRDEYSRALPGRRVLVIPDNDAPGRAHADQVLASLRGMGVEAARLELPDLPPKGDVTDWLNAGNAVDRLLALAQEALAAPDGAEFPESPPVTGPKSGDTGNAGNAAPPPEPLAAEAFHGIAGEILGAIAPHTEADPAALLLTLLSGLGNLIGPGPHARVGDTRHPLKLFVVIYGPTAKGRKGTSEDHVRALLRRLDPDWESSRIKTGISSGEGITYDVRDRIEIEEFDAKTQSFQRQLRDAGVADKRLWIIESEFANLLKVMSRDGNTVSPVVRLAWDDKPLQILTKNSPITATGTHISLVGHTTREELLRYLTRTEAGNGFGNRFLWVHAIRSQELPFGGTLPDLEPLAERLSRRVAAARRLGPVAWGAASRPIWVAIYGRLSAGRSGMFGAVTSRAEAQVLRLATLYAVLDGAAAIEPPHLLAALAVWCYCEESARYLFGDAAGDPTADAILAKLRQHPEGIDRNEIREVLSHRCSAAHLTQVLARLEAEGRLRRGWRPTRTRPAELLLPGDGTAGREAAALLALARRLALDPPAAGANRAESAERVGSHTERAAGAESPESPRGPENRAAGAEFPGFSPGPADDRAPGDAERERAETPPAKVRWRILEPPLAPAAGDKDPWIEVIL